MSAPAAERGPGVPGAAAAARRFLEAEGLRPTWAEVHLGRIQENCLTLRRGLGPGTELMAVVKADGYGHGAVAVARAALAGGATWLGVGTLEEGVALRRAGIRAPILVLGPLSPPQAAAYHRYRLRATVCQWEAAQALAGAAPAAESVPVHVKVDTGMGRLGLLPDEVVPFLAALDHLPQLEVEGIFTHFATADEADLTYAHRQLACFLQVLDSLAAAGRRIPYPHAANSAAFFRLPDARLRLVRVGIALYGISPCPEAPASQLRPALHLRSVIAFQKRVPAGWGVSYGRTYVTPSETWIGVVPIGYADGYPRCLGNRARVLVGAREVPVVGRVCMDQTLVDLGPQPAAADSIVTLFGDAPEGGARLPVELVARWAGTIPYELVTGLSARVPRVLLDGTLKILRAGGMADGP